MNPALRARTYGGPHPSSGSAVNAIINPSTFDCARLAAELADLWVRYCTHASLTPHTGGGYASGLRAFLRHCDHTSPSPSRLTLESPDLRALLLSFDEAVMTAHAPSTAGRRQRYLRTLLSYATACNIELSPPTKHWAATPPPLTIEDESYNLDEFTKVEAVRMRRAARRDADACIQRLRTASDPAGEFADLYRWVVECLRGQRTNAEVATALRGHPRWVEQVGRVCGVSDLAAEDYCHQARHAMTLAVPTRRELMAFFLLMAWSTGREPEVLRRLRLRDIDVDETRITLRLTKTRAAKTDTFVIPSDGSGSRLYTQVRDLITVTTQARTIHETDFLWLAIVQQSGRVGVARWHHARYGLHEYDADAGLELSRPHDTRRIRKTAKAIRAVRGGSLLAAIDGDHTEKTYRKHYQHTTSTMVAAAQAIHNAQDRVVEAALHLTVVAKLARDVEPGEVDQQAAHAVAEIAAERPAEKALTTTGCRDRRNGLFTDEGELCLGPPLACIGCRNAVVTLDNLPRILLAEQHIEELRDSTEPTVFLRVWGQALDWTAAVLDKFSPHDIRRARQSSAELFIPIRQRLSE